MIGFDGFDLMVRGGILSLLLLWSALLLRDYRHRLPARMAVYMNAGIVAHILGTLPSENDLGMFDMLLELVSVTTTGMFWLFSRTWFDDQGRIGWRSWALVLMTPATLGLVRIIEPYGGLPLLLAAIFLRSQMIAFGIAGLWVLWRGREDDLIEERRKLRGWLVGVVGAYVLIVNFAEIYVYNLHGGQWLLLLVRLGILIVTLGFCGLQFGIRFSDFFDGVADRANRPAMPDPAMEILAERVQSYMVGQKAWRDEKLSISGLAAALGEKEYRLRRVINGNLGHRNFAAFVNGFRLKEVKAALADRAEAGVPIITIALDAGFGSLGPFNRAFRDAEGMTPSEYRMKYSGSEVD